MAKKKAARKTVARFDEEYPAARHDEKGAAQRGERTDGAGVHRRADDSTRDLFTIPG